MPFDTDLARFLPVLPFLDRDDPVADPALTLGRAGRISVQWIPSDHVLKTARLVCVGITPGRHQANNTLRVFAAGLASGLPTETALRDAKLFASFSGPMRANIVRMLDAVGLNIALGLGSCSDLFSAAHERVHFTSALRYPVFIDGENYRGAPEMLRTPMLRSMVETYLLAEARAIPDALWLPLGPKPASALLHLVSLGALSRDRVLEGLPHPSGANAERIAFFLGLKQRSNLSRATLPDPIERARERLIKQVAGAIETSKTESQA